MATIDRLRKRQVKLRQELTAVEMEIAALERVPTQTALDGMPASTPNLRRPSVHEENYGEFLNSRADRLKKLEVEVVPDEKLQPAFVNARLKTIRAACRDDDELFALFDRYLFEDYWARCTPPFPFTGFAADKTWKRLLVERRAERTGESLAKAIDPDARKAS